MDYDIEVRRGIANGECAIAYLIGKHGPIMHEVVTIQICTKSDGALLIRDESSLASIGSLRA